MTKLIIVSGGQTGADQAGLRSAKKHHIPTAGFVPKGWMTEDGPAPWLAEYGLQELPSRFYSIRTQSVVGLADAMFYFGDSSSPGGRCTIYACEQAEVLYLLLRKPDLRSCQDFLVDQIFPVHETVRLMIAGNRERINPGIGRRVECFLDRLITQLRFDNLIE